MIETQRPGRSLEREMKTALIRCCGEQQIAYRVEVLAILAKCAADVAAQDRAQREGTPAMPTPTPGSVVPLMPLGVTPEQIVLLELIAAGLTDDRIASRMGLALHAAKTLLKRLFAALDADCRASAVALGYEYGILGPASRSARDRAARLPGTPGSARGAAVAPAQSAGRLEVLRAAAEGLDNAGIAAKVHMSVDQVRFRLRSWYTTSGAESRPDLVAWALRSGVLDGSGVAR